MCIMEEVMKVYVIIGIAESQHRNRNSEHWPDVVKLHGYGDSLRWTSANRWNGEEKSDKQIDREADGMF